MVPLLKTENKYAAPMTEVILLAKNSNYWGQEPGIFHILYLPNLEHKEVLKGQHMKHLKVPETARDVILVLS